MLNIIIGFEHRFCDNMREIWKMLLYKLYEISFYNNQIVVKGIDKLWRPIKRSITTLRDMPSNINYKINK